MEKAHPRLDDLQRVIDRGLKGIVGPHGSVESTNSLAYRLVLWEESDDFLLGEPPYLQRIYLVQTAYLEHDRPDYLTKKTNSKSELAPSFTMVE